MQITLISSYQRNRKGHRRGIYVLKYIIHTRQAGIQATLHSLMPEWINSVKLGEVV